MDSDIVAFHKPIDIELNSRLGGNGFRTWFSTFNDNRIVSDSLCSWGGCYNWSGSGDDLSGLCLLSGLRLLSGKNSLIVDGLLLFDDQSLLLDLLVDLFANRIFLILLQLSCGLHNLFLSLQLTVPLFLGFIAESDA